MHQAVVRRVVPTNVVLDVSCSRTSTTNLSPGDGDGSRLRYGRTRWPCRRFQPSQSGRDTWFVSARITSTYALEVSLGAAALATPSNARGRPLTRESKG